MFMFKYPDDPCSSRTWYPGQVGAVFLSLQHMLDIAIVTYGQALLFAVPLLCPKLIFLPLRIEFICIIMYVTIMKNDVHGVAL